MKIEIFGNKFVKKQNYGKNQKKEEKINLLKFVFPIFFILQISFRNSLELLEIL